MTSAACGDAEHLADKDGDRLVTPTSVTLPSRTWRELLASALHDNGLNLVDAELVAGKALSAVCRQAGWQPAEDVGYHVRARRYRS